MSEICSFYGYPKFIATGKSLGFCVLDDLESICGGDFRFCEKSEDMRKHLLDQRESRSPKNNSKEDQKPGI